MPQCEGFRRYGGAFTLGPVKWEQCKEEAEFTITVEQDGKPQTLPCCKTCWQEAITAGIRVLKIEPLPVK